jgi:copper transport protein
MRTRYFISVLFVIFGALAAAVPSFAHAKLVASKPNAGEALAISPARIELQFSARVQPAMSSLVVNSEGNQIGTFALETSADEKTLWIALPELGAGTYLVIWRALSGDDHMINGEFTFQVRSSAGAESSLTSESLSEGSGHDPMGHAGPPEKAENVNWSLSLVRWLMYAAVMILTGGIVFRLFVVGGMALDPSATGIFDRRITRIFFGAIGLLIVCLLVSLIQQTSSVFGSIDPRRAFAVLSGTTFGTPWLLQFGAALGIASLFFRTTSGRRAENAGVLRAALLLSFLILLAFSATGHARAASAEYRFAIPVDWLHLLAASMWVGGIVSIVFGLPALLSVVDGTSRLNVIAEAVRRFNKLAIAATIILALTGIYNSWIHVESFDALANTLYGRVLLGKIAVTTVMIVLGGINAFVIRPRIAAASHADGTPEDRRFFKSVAFEVSLAMIVLLLAAILAFLPPARGHMPIAAESSVLTGEQSKERNG